MDIGELDGVITQLHKTLGRMRAVGVEAEVTKNAMAQDLASGLIEVVLAVRALASEIRAQKEWELEQKERDV